MAKAPTPPPQSSAAMISAGIPSFVGGGTTDFLGMPANSADNSLVTKTDADAQLQWQQGKNAPAYANGAQYLPVMQNWTPADIVTIQQRMVNAGLLGNTDFRLGVWDDKSQSAFGDVLALANNMGRPWQEAMSSYESATPMQWDAKTNSYVKGTKGTARTNAPVVTRFTSPDDLATTAQEVATAKLGRSFSPEELQKFISSYHSTEASTSQAASAASGVGGGSFTDASSPTVAADTFAKQTDPNAYNSEQFLPLVEKMNQLLGGTPGLNTTKPMSA